MSLVEIILSKPVLIGLHLGFAIIGIDAFLWLLGEILASSVSIRRRVTVATIGLFGYVATWIIGGYYYVKFYGPLVKPIIIGGQAKWAHDIAMEAKEHVFLFAVPLAIVILLLSRLDAGTLISLGLRRRYAQLVAVVAGLGLSFGLMGFMISAAARWGAI